MTATRRCRPRWLALTSIVFAVLGGCSAVVAPSGPNSEKDFTSQLQSIVQSAGAQYGELADAAQALDPSEPVPQDFKVRMRELAASDRRAADKIEKLTPPRAAQEPTMALVAALRARADAFEEAAGEMDVSLRDLEETSSLVTYERALDEALRRLQDAGFLLEEPPHD